MSMGTLLPGLLFGGGLLASKALMPKARMPAMVRPVTRNMGAEAARRDDMWRRRRGAGANELTGGGAEAQTPGGKTLLGQ